LTNLLWVFSPTQSESFSSFPYPGDEYVDILGPTQYADDLSIPGYADYVRYNKPIGMAEYGPSEFNSLVLTGALDDCLYAQRLKQNPKVAFWVTWHSWNDGTKTVHMALVDNQNASGLLNDSYIINSGALHK
ncbi:MAG TPA: glycosyl hydrolase, partial [Bacillota bacterium]|nr:glycosyl hydrolase [Bacillota bacterium]